MSAEPWTESWAVLHAITKGRHVTGLTSDADHLGPITFFDSDDASIKRAHLAAAAPEMAQILMAIYAGDTFDGMCPECDCCVVDGSGHNDDCGLVAALHKAGVLP